MAKDYQDQVILICNCGSLNHAVGFTRFTDDNMCFVELVIPGDISLWQRIKFFVGYLFGKPCKFSVAEVVLTEEDVHEILEWCQRAEQGKENVINRRIARTAKKSAKK